MYRFSNTVIGLLNFFTLLASIPIIGGALWMARNSTTCEGFLQTPLLILGFIVLLISLAGFIGACFNVAWALWLYLVVMLFLIIALLSLTLFGLIVTSKAGNNGGGVGVEMGSNSKEYNLNDYSPWLKNRINNPQYWKTIRSCILGSNTCSHLSSWSPLNYLQRDMTPIQLGCCKPPSSCSYSNGGDVSDCYRWNGAVDVLCYECDSCKVGVIESVRKDWHKLALLNAVILLFLIAIYSIGCCAFRNAKRADSDYQYGHNRMTKIRPRWDYKMWRWLEDRKDQLY